MVSREVVESPQPQGSAEQIAWAFDFTAWSLGTITSPVVRVDDMTAPQAPVDVTSSVMPGNPTPSGQIVTCPLLSNLVAGHRYRLRCRVAAGGGVRELYLIVVCDF